MSPDDPRHGTENGYYIHRRDYNEAACEACLKAAAGINAQRAYAKAQGKPFTLTPDGSARRMQALAALGWSWVAVATVSGFTHQYIQRVAAGQLKRISRTNAQRLDRAFRELSMSLPPECNKGQRISASRARGLARRNGWLPPLAWDDIDAGIRAPYIKPVRGHDHAIVERIIGGDWHLARMASLSERNAVHDRWIAAGRSIRQLTELTGWEFRPKKGDAA